MKIIIRLFEIILALLLLPVTLPVYRFITGAKKKTEYMTEYSSVYGV